MRDKLLSALTGRPQTRESLCRKLNVTDRKLRRTVRELRLDGVPVCSNSKTGGYWLGSNKDTERMISEYRSRAAKMFEAARKMEEAVEREGQIDVLHGKSC